MNRRIIYLGWVAPGLRTPILQEEVGAQIVDDALHGPVLPRLGLEGARQALATTPAAEAGAKGLAMPGKEREGNDEEKGSVAQKMCHFEGCGVEPRISVRGDIFVESFQPAIDDHSAAVSTFGSKIVKPTGFTHYQSEKSQEFHPSLALLSRVGQTAPEIQVAVVTFRFSLDRAVTVVGELFLEHFTTWEG